MKIYRAFRPAIYTLLILIFAVLLAVVAAHCVTSAPHHDTRDLGSVAYLENPNTYIMGSIVAGDVIVEKASGRTRYATNIRFAPAYTFMLYNETILFCGNHAQDFNNQTGAIVVTYRKQAHEIVSGVACHELEAVDKLADKALP